MEGVVGAPNAPGCAVGACAPAPNDPVAVLVPPNAGVAVAPVPPNVDVAGAAVPPERLLPKPLKLVVGAEAVPNALIAPII